jgi:two-component system, NarL family, nitrate/nitrite response regulator NarL
MTLAIPTAKQHAGAIRVLIADDHPVVRLGIRNMLITDDAFKVVGEASDGKQAIARTLALLPNILLLDLSMPHMPGMEALHAIMADTPQVKVVLLTASITPQQIVEALQIGARGVVTKDAIANNLRMALCAVFEGDYWIHDKRVFNLVGALRQLISQAVVPHRKTFGLTQRELEIVGCIVEGCANRDIAKQHNISQETVKRHLANIFGKVEVSTRLELALFALAHQLVIA